MRLLILVLLLAGLSLGPARAAGDPFRGGRAADTPAEVALPTSAGAAVAWLARQQAGLNQRISTEIRDVADSGAVPAVFVALMLCFAYGVLHAAGPGHGKMVVASYLLARRERWLAGAVIGGLISLIQGVSAVLIVGVLGLVLRWAQFDVVGQAPLIEAVSYGAILAIGVVMLLRAATGRGHAHHHHLPHHHDGAAHDHVHDHGNAAPARRPFAPWLVLSAGLTPCTGAIIVQLFALANGVFWLGALAALAMSAGMGITVAALGILSVVLRGTLERLFGGAGGDRLERVLDVGGSALLVLFGLLLFVGACAQL